jgi:hypothetical protein
MQLLDLVENTRILNEASIFSREGAYSYGHKVKLSTSVKGEALLRAIQKELPEFDPTQELTWTDPEHVDIESIPLVHIGKGKNYRVFTTPEGEQFAIVGADSSIETGLIHANRFNKGDIAEAALGAAITAKLILRNGSSIGDVTVDDLQDILNRSFKTNGSSLVIKAKDQNSKISDKIVFSLRLPAGSQEALEKVENWKQFENIFASAVHYANSPDAERYSNYFYKNGKVDEVRIISDGVTSQKGTKTDVKALVTTTDPETGEVKERTLKNVDISLKADSVKYGQSTSGGLLGGPETWLASAKRTFEPLGITLDMPARGKNDILKFFTAIYKQVVEKLNTELANASFAGETIFIEKIADLINFHGSGGGKTLRIVSFDKGSSTIHSFHVVKAKLKERNIDLRCKLSIGARSNKPTIHIYDAHDPTGKGLLTNIRFYLTEKASTNYFEKGPLLHELTRIEKKPAVVTKQGPAKASMTAVPATPKPQANKPVVPTTPQPSNVQIDHPSSHIGMDSPEQPEYTN